MKNLSNHVLAAGLIAAAALTAQAQPQPAPPGASAAATAPEGRWHFDPAKRQERMARRLEAFKQKLQLSPAQEGAWSAFAALKPTMPMQRPDRAEFARMTTPERLDRMKQMQAQRMAEMDKRADATKSFYAVLNPQQQKVFDDATLRLLRHRGFHHHHG
jgi:periplasmic protein CpxP/Spy